MKRAAEKSSCPGRVGGAVLSENTRFFTKIIPSLRASVSDILDCQHLQGQRVEVPVCGGVTCWWHPAPHPNASGVQQAAPVVFELHGGGFVLGDARKDDAFCAALRDSTGAHVVGIDYPKAPEQPYPAAVNGVWEVLLWFAQNAARFQMDTRRFALVGFSSGGNLAAVTALHAADGEKIPFQIAAQVLHYPFLDAATPPLQKNPQPWDLQAEVMEAFTELYCAGEPTRNPAISPVFASPEALRVAPPALILTAERDALQAEGAQYARLLQAAGASAEYTAIPHAHHGYMEDWFNPACYGAAPEDTRALHKAQFGVSAQQALAQTAHFLKKSWERQPTDEIAKLQG